MAGDGAQRKSTQPHYKAITSNEFHACFIIDRGNVNRNELNKLLSKSYMCISNTLSISNNFC